MNNNRKQTKQAEAKIRQEASDKLTPSQRLEALDRRGVVATRERRMLQARVKGQGMVLHGPDTMAEPTEPARNRRR